MLEDLELRRIQYSKIKYRVNRLLRAKSDFSILGCKSSGKTHLLTTQLNQYLGQQNYISIKCIFASSRQALLFLISQSFINLFETLSSKVKYCQDPQFLKLKRFIKQDNQISIQSWNRKMIKLLTYIRNQLQINLSHIYILLDNIQDIRTQDQFLRQLHRSLKNQIQVYNISIIYCGLTHKSPYLWLIQPFRKIPQLIMPKPDITIAIQGGITSSQIYKRYLKLKQKSNIKQCAQYKKLLQNSKMLLYNDLQSTQYQLQNIFFMTINYMYQVQQFIQNNCNLIKLWLSNQSHQLVVKALQNIRTQNHIRSQQPQNNDNQTSFDFYRQNYPKLILSSLSLANQIPQSQDRKKFIDLKKTKTTKAKSIVYAKQNKQNMRSYQKHNHQRIVSISQVLQQQSSHQLQYLNQKDYPHHTLDYYGCYQYLRHQGYLTYYGKDSYNFGGRIFGQNRQNQTIQFFQKIGLQYEQFVNKKS